MAETAGTRRRHALLQALREASGPLSGGRLAKHLGVSRQVIVQDVALLRVDGNDIMATSRGYVLAAQEGAGAIASEPSVSDAAPSQTNAEDSCRGMATESTSGSRPRRTLKMHHTVDQASDELLTIVGLGGVVLDVVVHHRVYGRLSAPLGIASRADVLRFVNQIESGKSSPLLTVTSGYHYHTIEGDSDATLDRIERALDAKGYLAPPKAKREPGEA